MTQNPKTTLTTGYDLYQLLQSYIGSTYTVSNRARKASTLSIEGNNIHFDLVNGSTLAKYIVKRKYEQRVTSLLAHLERNNSDVIADNRRKARASIKTGDLDKAFAMLNNHVETNYQITSRVRGGEFVSLKFYYHEGNRHRGRIVDVVELDNNTALAYILKSYYTADGDDSNRSMYSESLIDDLEHSFGSWRELKLNALLSDSEIGEFVEAVATTPVV